MAILEQPFCSEAIRGKRISRAVRLLAGLAVAQLARALGGCDSESEVTPIECNGMVFETEAVFPGFCLYDGGIKGDCAGGVCLPRRDWTPADLGLLPCSVEWWVPLAIRVECFSDTCDDLDAGP
jgi:hypothetical protein